MTTHFQNGVTNAAPGGALGTFKALDPTKYHSFFDDFTDFAAGSAGASRWRVVEEGAAGTQAVEDTDGGVVALTTGPSTGQTVLTQLHGEQFKLSTGKEFHMLARFALSTAAGSSLMFIGLTTSSVASNLYSGAWGMVDGVGFRKDAGDAALDWAITKNASSTTATALTTLANNTFVEAGLHWDGIDQMTYTIDGVKKGRKTVTTTLPDDEVLTPTVFIETGEAKTHKVRMDYLLVAKER